MSLFLILLLSLNPVLFSGPAVNGVKIVTRQVTGGFTDLRTEYFTPDRLRNEWQTRAGERVGPAMASIIQRGDRDRVFVLDLGAKEYVTYEAEPKAAQGKAMPQSGGTLQIWIDSTDTGERRKMFGLVAKHIITQERRVASPGTCSRGSESRTDGWYIDASAMPEWSQPNKNSLGVVVASVVSAGPGGNCLDKMDKIEVHRTGIEPGIPVKVTTTMSSEVTGRNGNPRTLQSSWASEILEIKQGPLDPALFQVPGDFRRVESLRSWIPIAPIRRPLTGWEWVKEKLEEIFR
ncbi:MAG TPA: hypothetical protein VLT16_04305 [Candidatus Limnocylindrales bacterium]|nr:hypothetical protein [Candidatus Limnocylindrales bacterium]